MTHLDSSFNPLAAFSDRIATLVEQLGRGVVALGAGRGSTVAAFGWQPGVLVTVAHAIRHGGSLRFVGIDGVEATATVAGVDPSTDLAVLRTDVPIEPLALGDDAAIRTGHWVCAVTRDRNGGLRVDQGLIGQAASGYRTWRGGRIDRLLALDGGLAPGFSGAPIATADGQVIGLATSALSRGAGIVIPRATIDRVAAQLLADGRVARGFLGVGAQPAEAKLADAAAERAPGLLITALTEGGPAERAGILVGDILLSFGGAPTRSIDELQGALASSAIGAAVDATLARGGEPVTRAVTIDERPRARC